MGNPYSPLPLSQSLTVVAGVSKNERSRTLYTGAQRYQTSESRFVAQLLAVKHDVAEYRQRRTTSPETARIAYTAGKKQGHKVQSAISIAA